MPLKYLKTLLRYEKFIKVVGAKFIGFLYLHLYLQAAQFHPNAALEMLQINELGLVRIINMQNIFELVLNQKRPNK